MTERSEFVIVGAGLLGLAAARALASRGREVTVLEQAEIGHPGARFAGQLPDLPARLPRSRLRVDGQAAPGNCGATWRHERGLRLLHRSPQLTFGAGLDAVQAAMAAAGAPCELLPAATAAARFPALATVPAQRCSSRGPA